MINNIINAYKSKHTHAYMQISHPIIIRVFTLEMNCYRLHETPTNPKP